MPGMITSPIRCLSVLTALAASVATAAADTTSPPASAAAGGIAGYVAVSLAPAEDLGFDGSGPIEGVCEAAAARAEIRHGIPTGLLAAISKVETGRGNADGSAIVAWPYAINAEGTGMHFNNAAEAIAQVQSFQASGMESIDIGCMQINLKWHPNAFASLAEGFDPETNADYAARYLAELAATHGTWNVAVGFYHSSTPHRQAYYRTKVMEAWNGNYGGGADGTASMAMAAPVAPVEPRPQIAPSPLFGGLTALQGSAPVRPYGQPAANMPAPVGRQGAVSPAGVPIETPPMRFYSLTPAAPVQ